MMALPLKIRSFALGLVVNNLVASVEDIEMWVSFQGWEDSLEEIMASYSLVFKT